MAGQILINEGIAPVTPPTGYSTLYVKADGQFYTKDDQGNETPLIGGGSVVAVTVASANGLAGSSSGGISPVLTLSTSITGILKGNGTAVSAASAGTDYFVPGGALSATTGAFSGQITSTLATGTAPLVVTSTTQVSNLNVARAGVADTVTIVDAGGDTSTWLMLATGQTGNIAPVTDGGLTYNANTNALTATTFVGALTGNADTVTTNANLSGAITSVGNTTTMNSALDSLTDVSASSPSTGDNLRWSGTAWIAASATSVVGSANTFYLDATSTVADNLALSTTPSIYAEVINSKACTAGTSPVFFERFCSSALGRTSIPAGTWTFNIYAACSGTAGNNVVNFRVNKRVLQVGLTGTFTGAGATRTFTVSGGTPFVPGDANASRLLAGLVDTPTQTAWISGYTSSSEVTVTLTDPAFVNVSGVTLTAIYYYLFNDVTPDMSSTSVTLYTVASVQGAFAGLNLTDSLVAAFFGTTDGNRTLSLYYGGSTHYTNFTSPLTTLHNDLAGLNVGDYKHLTAAEYSALGSGGISVSKTWAMIRHYS